MMDHQIQILVADIRSYCVKHGMEPTTFGAKAVNDGKLVGRLEMGRTITLTTLAAIQRQLALPPSESAHKAAAA